LPAVGVFAWIARKLLEAFAAVIAASALSFLVISLTPGDPAAYVLRAQSGNYAPSEGQLQHKRLELGLERPGWKRYGQWLAAAAKGDLGFSYRSGEAITKMIGQRLGPTLKLACVAAILALLLATGLALASSLYANRWPDHAITAVCSVLASLPSFATCLILVDLICIRLKLVPLLSDGALSSSLLPASCLALTFGAWWAQLLRANMLTALARPFAETALARGSSAFRVAWVHALPIAYLSTLGMIALGIGHMLAGTAIIEAVFNWPGTGSLLVRAISERDQPLIQALAVLAMFAFVVLAFVGELIVRAIDTRKPVEPTW
jgi:ABC-type dipeptide/oligopeptide/nickel transport system permease component